MSSSVIPYHHTPVLLSESIDALITNTDGVYVDATFGGGGHSREILRRLSPRAKLFAFDQDDAVRQQLPEDSRIVWIKSNFKYLKKYMEYYNVESLDGVLADLGVSSHHFDDNRRGFSFHSTAPLDMRMNELQSTRAIDILMQYKEADLAIIFSKYGELTNAKKIANAIIHDRRNRRWDSCLAFAEWADTFVYGKRNKWMAQLFQALRIEVNQELQSLESLLSEATQCMRSDASLVVISYHSLEDRLVKTWMKQDASQDVLFGTKNFLFKSWSKQAITASEEELIINSRSRSARMRVAIKA